jgi:hypothetical protein
MTLKRTTSFGVPFSSEIGRRIYVVGFIKEGFHVLHRTFVACCASWKCLMSQGSAGNSGAPQNLSGGGSDLGDRVPPFLLYLCVPWVQYTVDTVESTLGRSCFLRACHSISIRFPLSFVLLRSLDRVPKVPVAELSSANRNRGSTKEIFSLRFRFYIATISHRSDGFALYIHGPVCQARKHPKQAREQDVNPSSDKLVQVGCHSLGVP